MDPPEEGENWSAEEYDSGEEYGDSAEVSEGGDWSDEGDEVHPDSVDEFSGEDEGDSQTKGDSQTQDSDQNLTNDVRNNGDAQAVGPSWDTDNSEDENDHRDDDEGSDDGSDGMDLEAAGVMFSTPGSVTSDMPEDDLLNPLGAGHDNEWSDEGSETDGEADHAVKYNDEDESSDNENDQDVKKKSSWLSGSLFGKKQFVEEDGELGDSQPRSSRRGSGQHSKSGASRTSRGGASRSSKGSWFVRQKRQEEDEQVQYHDDDALSDDDDDDEDPEQADKRSIPDKVMTHRFDDDIDKDEAVSTLGGISTREEQLITYLSLAVCILVLVIIIGVVVVVVVLVGGRKDKKSDAKPTPGSPIGPPSNAAPSPDIVSTYAPTPADIDPLQNMLREKSLALDGAAALFKIDSPQNKAYNWLSRNSNLNSYSDAVKLQRYALATFYFSTGGDRSWGTSARTGWLSDTPECEWGSTANNICTGDVYTSLTLDFVGLSGTLPPEISFMTRLTRLSIRGNDDGTGLEGSIPASYGELKFLETVRLQGNAIVGTLPHTMGSWTAARIINLERNNITGTIPTEVGFMSSTASLNLFNNLLSGKIPTEIGRMASLGTFNVANNNLSGSIPSEIGIVESLATVDMSRNQLENTIPTTVGNLLNIRGKSDLANPH